MVIHITENNGDITENNGDGGNRPKKVRARASVKNEWHRAQRSPKHRE